MNVHIALDLDDTLYPEKDYFVSGLQCVADVLKKVCVYDTFEFMMSEFEQENQAPIFQRVCQEYGLPSSFEEELVWTYRLHTPNISLDDDAKSFLKYAEHRFSGISIVTDGRLITQWLKVNALGIAKYPLYVSEQWDGPKPKPKRFEYLQEVNKKCKLVYIGDNVSKDFFAPNKLGWKTICLLDKGGNIHKQDIISQDEEFRPQYCVNSLMEALDCIEGDLE